MEWATAAISTGSKLDAFALKDWLDDVRELRGRSEVVVLPTDVGSQGGVTDVLVVALSSGGVVALLVDALPKWLALRRNVGSLKVKVTRQDGRTEVEVEMDQSGDRAALIETILHALEDGDGGG